jgi:hypothetical protein
MPVMPSDTLRRPAADQPGKASKMSRTFNTIFVDDGLAFA